MDSTTHEVLHDVAAELNELSAAADVCSGYLENAETRDQATVMLGLFQRRLYALSQQLTGLTEPQAPARRAA